MTKTVPQHHDRLGREIQLETVVAYPSSNRLSIGRVIKLNNKMIRVVDVEARSSWARNGVNKYPADCVTLEGADVTMYLLKRQS
jgi:hypothetical protein